MNKDDDIMSEIRAFMKSRIILTAAELDMFSDLESSPSTAGELAGRKALEVRATTRVLDCLVVYGLLMKTGDKYSLTEKGAPLSAHNSQSVLPMVLHMNRLWDTWSSLTEVVQSGTVQQRKPGTGMDEAARNAFIGAMHVVGRQMAEKIASVVDLSGFRRLLDIGGASGSYTIAMLSRNPDLKAVLFDLDPVIPLARKRLSEDGLIGRVELVPGDFYRDELPGGCDLALLSAIIHQNSPTENVELYRKIFRALVPGGVLLIRDHVMDESRTFPPDGAVFAINMLVNTTGGDTYTFSEIKAGLEAAGFRSVELIESGQSMDGIVRAAKPN